MAQPRAAAEQPRQHRALLQAHHVGDFLRRVTHHHLQHQRPMMSRFLDLLGIAHEEGLISDESPAAPAPEKLDEAVKTLASEFPHADVSRYFWTLLWQDPETWGGLQGRPELAVD